MIRFRGLLFAVALVVSCGSPTQPVLTRVEHLEVASSLAPCVGVAQTTCMQTRTHSAEPWTLFYDDIVGFTFEPGFEYELEVAVYRLHRTAADGFAERYELQRVISKVSDPPA